MAVRMIPISLGFYHSLAMLTYLFRSVPPPLPRARLSQPGPMSPVEARFSWMAIFKEDTQLRLNVNRAHETKSLVAPVLAII